MTERNFRAFFSLLILFLIDLLRPFGYSLITEFTFLGIIFVAINYPLRTALIFGMIFGYLKDVASTTNVAFNLFEFTLLVIFVHYFLYNFRKKAAFFFIFYAALIIHLAVNNLYIHQMQYIFSLLFIIHSSIAFLLLNYILSPWLDIQKIENDKF